MDDPTRPHGLDRVRTAHADLVRHLDDLVGDEGADPAVPSALPGWTRGHVLTHVARNADSFVRVLRAGERGEAVAQYEGGPPARNAAIEDGAGRDWLTLVDDVAQSASALEQTFAGQTVWTGSYTTSGETPALAELPFRRWREVLIHHADLGDAAFTPADWPAEYQREELRRLEMRWNSRRPMGATGLPAAALHAPSLDRLLWLLGRAEIDGLAPAEIF